jgi:hypothetical protein
VIEHDGALQRILRRLFSTEGYGLDVLHKVLLWKWLPTTSDPYRSKPSALVDRLRMLMRSRSHVSPESLHVFEGGMADFSNLILESNPSEGAES